MNFPSFNSVSRHARRYPAVSTLVGIVLLGVASGARLVAQDSYEIQVYGSETLPAGDTMVELHSNFTIDGLGGQPGGVLPNHHALHETLEITHGFNSWFETGVYVFSSVQPGRGWEWVGNHIRPRVRVPEAWHWPVGLSLSTEIGYVRQSFAEDAWAWELRPIIDKQFRRFYVAVNPTFGRALHGPNVSRGFEFSPSGKFSFEVFKKIGLGVEYYSALGPVTRLDDFGEQRHQIVPVVDIEFSPRWEFNFGVGVGLNHSSDGLFVKLILGRRF